MINLINLIWQECSHKKIINTGKILGKIERFFSFRLIHFVKYSSNFNKTRALVETSAIILSSYDSFNSRSSLTHVKIATVDTETTLINETTDFEYATETPRHLAVETTSSKLQPEIKSEESDIDDRDDEESTLRSSSNKCRADDTVRCHDGSRYICSVQQCDGVPDCDDGGDENDCPHPGTG